MIVRQGERERERLTEKKSSTKFENRAHFLLLQKNTCGEQVLEPAVVEREELVLQRRELLPLQVIQKHYSSVLRTRDG